MRNLRKRLAAFPLPLCPEYGYRPFDFRQHSRRRERERGTCDVGHCLGARRFHLAVAS